MKGDLSKLFAFFSSKPSRNHKKRPRSSLIAYPSDLVDLAHTSPSVGLTDVAKDNQHIHFPNNTLPRTPQPGKRKRSMSVSGVGTASRQGKYCTRMAPSNPSGHPHRERFENVDIHNCFVEEDFDIEDIQEIWRLLKDRSIYNETSLQGGLLTTTLCSTEL